MVFQLKSFLLFVCLASGSSWAREKPSYYPVILVPGTYSSRLEAKLDKPSVTASHCLNKTEGFVPLYIASKEPLDCQLENLRIFYDPDTRHTKNQEGVEIRVPGFGSSSVVANLGGGLDGNYFRDLIDELTPLGYKDRVSLRGAPYDFRRGLNEFDQFYKELNELVVNTYKRNGNTKVVFIGHDLGSLLVTLFLNQQTTEFRETYVQSLISLGGAFGGYVTPIIAYLQSFQKNPGYGDSISFARNYSAPFALFPNLAAFSKDYVLVQTPSKKYSLSNINELFQDAHEPVSSYMYQDNYDIVSKLQAPGVELHCLYGNATTTVTRISYPKNDFPYGTPKEESDFGDGLVPVASSKVCAQFGTKQTQPVYDVPLPASGHSDIIRFGKSIDYIKKVLKIN